MKIESKEEQKLREIKEQLAIEEKTKPISLKSLLETKFPENKWLIEKLIPLEGITIIAGAPASYKTWVILEMAIQIAKGGVLFDKFSCEESKVLIIDEENHLRMVQERLKLLGASPELPISFLSQTNFIITEEEIVKKVLEVCNQEGINVIFIDSLVRVNRAEENDASQMSEVFRAVKKLCQEGKTVILTHHERKEGAFKVSAQNRLRGSSDILASVDSHIAMQKDKDDQSRLIIEQPKLRCDKEIEPLEVKFISGEDKAYFEYLGAYQEKSKKKDLAKEIIPKILDNQADGMSRGDIVKKVRESEKIGQKSIREALDEMLQEEIIFEKSGSGNEKLCCLDKYRENDDLQEIIN